MRDSGPRHLADPPPLQRRWWLWSGAAVAVLLVVAGVAWMGPPGDHRPAPGEPPRGRSAAPEAGAVSTTTEGVATPAARPADDGPRNLLGNASFEDGSEGWRPLGGALLTKTTEAREGGYSLRISADPRG